MERSTPLSPPAPAGGAEVAEIGDGETAAEGAAGAKDENGRGGGNSAPTITSMVMTFSNAGTGSSTTYLHSSSSRNPSTTTSRSSFPGIVGMAAGAASRGNITVPVTAGAGAVCHRNSPTVSAGEDANCVIKARVVLVEAGAGGSHGALMGEVIWGAVPLPPLTRTLTASSNRGGPLTDR